LNGVRSGFEHGVLGREGVGVGFLGDGFDEPIPDAAAGRADGAEALFAEADLSGRAFDE